MIVSKPFIIEASSTAPGESEEDVSFFVPDISDRVFPLKYPRRITVIVSHPEASRIPIDEYRTGMVGKGEEILRFPVADLLSSIEIGSDFCAHGITAEKSEEKSTGTGRGDAEYFT